MSLDRPVGEDDLQAFVDGRLAPGRGEIVRSFLHRNPDLAEEVEAFRAHRTALSDRLRFKADEPIPARLRIAAILGERQGRARRRLKAALAASLWLVAGGVAGWCARDVLAEVRTPAPAAAMAREALSAHRVFAVEVVHPVEVRADQQGHLAQWLSKRLGQRLAIPDLTSQGLRLVGGRLLPTDTANLAAQLMYEDEQGVRTTVYVRGGEAEATAFRYLREGDLQAFYWIDRGFGYAVSGQIDRPRLMRIAEAVFQVLEDAGSGQGRPSL